MYPHLMEILPAICQRFCTFKVLRLTNIRKYSNIYVRIHSDIKKLDKSEMRPMKLLTQKQLLN
jgi:hypothetical protein